MLVGRFPFNGGTRQELSAAILRGVFSSPPMSREPEALIRRMLVLEPNQRYTIENVRHHPWMARLPGEGEISTEHAGARKIEPRAVGALLGLGFCSEHIERSVGLDRHDHVNASYLLLLEKRRRKDAYGGGGSGGAVTQQQQQQPTRGVYSGAGSVRPPLQPEQQAAQAAQATTQAAQAKVAQAAAQDAAAVTDHSTMDQAWAQGP